MEEGRERKERKQADNRGNVCERGRDEMERLDGGAGGEPGGQSLGARQGRSDAQQKIHFKGKRQNCDAA